MVSNTITVADVPNAPFPTDNVYDVPVLDLALQGKYLDLPFVCWGTRRRSEKNAGTYHFYTSDARFEALWADPTPVVNSGCVTVIEPNFSLYDNWPVYAAINQIGKKRWLSRYFQSFGIRVFVDLNVGDLHRDLNLLGVPDGWASFATRGYSDHLVDLDREYEIACRKAAGVTPTFVVYGGGKAVKDCCMVNHWLWMPEQRDQARVLAGQKVNPVALEAVGG